MAEEMIVKASDAKQKSVCREKPNGSEFGRFFFLQNKNPSATMEDQSWDPPATVENQNKSSSDSSMFSNALKGSDRTWSKSGLLKASEEESKQWVA